MSFLQNAVNRPWATYPIAAGRGQPVQRVLSRRRRKLVNLDHMIALAKGHVRPQPTVRPTDQGEFVTRDGLLTKDRFAPVVPVHAPTYLSRAHRRLR
jgi:hypothetical protein